MNLNDRMTHPDNDCRVKIIFPNEDTHTRNKNKRAVNIYLCGDDIDFVG